jgi:nicotinate-nucleotide adenylyltransferase
MARSGGRLGVLGGTFDPPHVGHLSTAVTVRHALGLDRVALVVANHPWHKADRGPVTPAAVRLAMVRAAVDGVEGLEASDVEIQRGGDSFTVDTLEELAALDPAGQRFLILGADAAAGLPRWSRPERVAELATLVLVERAGAPSALPAGWSAERVVVPRLDVSSSDLRRRVAEGWPIDFLTPPGVVDHIAQQGTYGGRP